VLSKGKTKTARLWVYLADPHSPYPICLYDYTASRSQQGPLNYLKTYRGYLQADAYSGYNVLYENYPIIEVGCFAHARRKFFEVALAAQGPSYASDMVQRIGELYDIERQAKGMSCPERYFYRKKHSKPKLKTLRRHIKRVNPPFITLSKSRIF